jgi:hypothetical protein
MILFLVKGFRVYVLLFIYTLLAYNTSRNGIGIGIGIGTGIGH